MFGLQKLFHANGESYPCRFSARGLELSGRFLWKVPGPNIQGPRKSLVSTSHPLVRKKICKRPREIVHLSCNTTRPLSSSIIKVQTVKEIDQQCMTLSPCKCPPSSGQRIKTFAKICSTVICGCVATDRLGVHALGMPVARSQADNFPRPSLQIACCQVRFKELAYLS